MPARELEVKFAAPRAAVEAVFGQHLQDAAPKRLRAVYFDTAEFDLRRANLSLRLRCDDGHWVQTLKSGPGVVSRDEDEHAAPDARLRLGRLAQSPMQARLMALRDELRPVFETHVRRKVFLLDCDGAQIEAAFDEGEVRAGAERDEISEIELELKGGATAGLIQAARRLAGAPGFRLALTSKAARGYALICGEDAGASPFRAPHLDKQVSVGEGLQGVIMAVLAHFEANASRAAADAGVDTVHQTRVALRRLRVLTGAFPKLFGDESLEPIRARLAQLASACASARALDVFAIGVAQPYVGAEGPMAAPGLAAALLDARERAADQVRARLAAPQLNEALLDLIDWTLDGPWTRDAARTALREQPLRKLAAKALRHRLRVLARRGAEADWEDADQLHHLRIQAKKARYLADSLPVKGLDGALTALRALLGELGAVHDLAVAPETFALIQAERPGDTTLALSGGVAIGRLQAKAPKHLARARDAWDQVLKSARDQDLA